MISTVASLFKMSSFDKKLKACKETIKYILHTHTHKGGGGPTRGNIHYSWGSPDIELN